jgi:predicted ArsR family transcriptional regulator
VLYALTPEAAELFPRAYAPVLDGLLDALSQRLPPGVLEETVREVGRQMARERPLARGDLRERAVAAAALLEELGGMPEVREVDGAVWIAAWSCPLAAVVPSHPELCRLVEALLAEMMDALVRERCERDEPPRCSFEVVSSGQRARTGANKPLRPRQ